MVCVGVVCCLVFWSTEGTVAGVRLFAYLNHQLVVFIVGKRTLYAVGSSEFTVAAIV